MTAIEVSNLSKSYGDVQALRGVSFAVQEGELFGLIGPDGAGKTTLFRILATLLLPGGGSATVEGLDVVADYQRLRTLVGYMPGRFSLYPDLTVEENLQFFASPSCTAKLTPRSACTSLYDFDKLLTSMAVIALLLRKGLSSTFRRS